MRLISLGSLLGIGSIALGAVACTSGGEEADPAGTGGEAAGDGDGDGDTGDGDMTGDGDGDVMADPDAVACPTPASDFVIDFTYDTTNPEASPENGSFGDFTDTFSGGTFPYGSIMSDVTGDEWHLTGSITDYSGFGLFFNECTLVDASAFSGISFTISGDTGGTPITLNVGTAENEITSAWLEANTTDPVEPNHGRCEPTTGQYDGTCAAPSYQFDITDTPTTVEIMWSDLTGGSPASSVDPSEITFISWNVVAPTGVGTASVEAYDVDIVVDDIAFMP